MNVNPNTKRLKSSGLKMTSQRAKILEVFEKSQQRHLNAEEVYRLLINEGQEVSIATVYRVLAQFEQTGLLTRHTFDANRSVYEYNLGEHHDHIICLDCGHVEEFTNAEIESLQDKVAEKDGFKVADHVLYLFAHCTKTNCDHRT